MPVTMLPEEVVAEFSGAGAVVSVERIKHGLTNESWLVRTQADAMVVRFSNAAEQALQINRASETSILKAVAQAGIGPEVLLCDPSRHLLVTRYAGPAWAHEDAVADSNIVRIAMLLRRLHSLEAPSALHGVDLVSITDRYLQTLLARKDESFASLVARRDAMMTSAARLQNDTLPCLCHNDVHALNLVGSQAKDEVRLIDWEYAGLGEPMFDLASICVYHRYTSEQRERLLHAYSAASADEAAPRLKLACELFEYIRDLWMAVRSLTPAL